MMTLTKLSKYESDRVVLAIVNGDSDAAKLRENQLKSSIWREVQTFQFINTHKSACSILDAILGVDPIKLQDIRDKLERICTGLPAAPKPNWIFSPLGYFFSSR
jgi:hypothetical protein